MSPGSATVRTAHHGNPPVNRAVYWTPRILCLAFAAFLSLFALDVFSMQATFWEKAAGFMIHLIPTWIVLAVLAVGWRREWVGATGPSGRRLLRDE